MAKTGQKAEEMIELQTTARALEVEILGRYVSEPGHLDRIRLILAETFDQLAALRELKLAAGGSIDCPNGYVHKVACLCFPVSGATSGEDPAGARQKELARIARAAGMAGRRAAKRGSAPAKRGGGRRGKPKG
jgi:hypothetical protein